MIRFFLALTLIFSTSVFAQQDFSPAEGKLMKNEALKLWPHRDISENLEEALSKFEMAHMGMPDDRETLLYLIRGNYLMGDAHIEDLDRKKAYFERAFTYGEKALNLNPDYLKKIQNDEKIEKAVEVLNDKDVPFMYWTAVSIGKFARATGIFASMNYKDKILALIRRVEKLEPNYFFGAVPRYLADYYCLAPGISGGDMKEGQKQFNESMDIAPEYVGTKVLMADDYYTKKDDKKQFKKILNEVIETSKFDRHPEIGPENRLEKIKAQKLLSKIKELF